MNNILGIDENVETKETEKEENKIEEKEEKFGFRYNDFEPGKKVVIINGVNSGRFGVLQMDKKSKLKTNEKGYHGVDITEDDGSVGGFWIHPQDMQRKKFIAREEVMVIRGKYAGKLAIIQPKGNSEILKFKKGKYNVLIDLGNNTRQPTWIHFDDLISTDNVIMKFQTNNLGLTLDGKRISDVKAGYLADKMGVLVGWTIKNISGIENPSQEQIINEIKEAKTEKRTFEVLFDPKTTKIPVPERSTYSDEPVSPGHDDGCVCF